MTSVKHCQHCLRGYTGDACACSRDAVRCFANVSHLCYAGSRYPDDVDWRDDGTYDADCDAIVCDACYVLVCEQSPSGSGLRDEIAPTLARIRATMREAA